MAATEIEGFPQTLPQSGERVLCLAPPGELRGVVEASLEQVGPGGRVVVPVRGDPYVQANLPARVEVIHGDPGQPPVAGPFDVVLAWSRVPFLGSLSQFLVPVRDSLRPGGRLELDLPTYGFCPLLQACDPRAADWYLPGTDALREALEVLGFRDIAVSMRVELRSYGTLAQVVDDWIRPFPLAFEGEAGAELTRRLRGNLVRAFEGSRDLSLALRRARGAARR